VPFPVVEKLEFLSKWRGSSQRVEMREFFSKL
jgi:hypothetical protein